MAKSTLLAAPKALKQFAIDGDEFPDLSAEVTLYTGKTKLATLDLDREERDVFVDGDLDVTGDVLNLDDESGRCLVVRGSLRARSLIVGGSYVVVKNHVELEVGLYAHYNHGSVAIGGTVRAPFILAPDSSEVSFRRADAIIVTGTESLVSEVVDDGGVVHAAVVKRMRAGAPIVNAVAAAPMPAPAAGTVLVDLRGMKLTAFPKDKQLPATVEVLELAYNRISSLPAAIGRLVALRRLGLRYADTKKLDRALFGLASLEQLDLRGCNVAIPNQLERLTRLRVLRMSTVAGAKLAVENGALALPALEVLELSGNLDAVPNEVSTSRTLVELDLSNNRLEGLPELALPALRRFTLDNVERLSAPPVFDGMPSLVELELKGKGPVPRAVFALRNLTALRLSGFELPDSFASFTALRELELFACRFATFPTTLLSLTRLEKLNLRLTRASREDIAALLDAMPNVSLTLESSEWPEPAERAKGEALIGDLAAMSSALTYGKPSDRLDALRSYVARGLAAVRRTAGSKFELDEVIAQYVALRYGVELLLQPKLKDRDALLADLVAVAKRITIAQPIRVRSLADTYRGPCAYLAAAVLARAALDAGTPDLAAADALWLHLDDSPYGLTAPTCAARVETLVALGQTEAAAKCLHRLLDFDSETAALKSLQQAEWYRSARVL